MNNIEVSVEEIKYIRNTLNNILVKLDNILEKQQKPKKEQPKHTQKTKQYCNNNYNNPKDGWVEMDGINQNFPNIIL